MNENWKSIIQIDVLMKRTKKLNKRIESKQMQKKKNFY